MQFLLNAKIVKGHPLGSDLSATFCLSPREKINTKEKRMQYKSPGVFYSGPYSCVLCLIKTQGELGAYYQMPES